MYVEREAAFEWTVFEAMEKAGLLAVKNIGGNYSVSDGRLAAWVEFLRQCGGFAVW